MEVLEQRIIFVVLEQVRDYRPDLVHQARERGDLDGVPKGCRSCIEVGVIHETLQHPTQTAYPLIVFHHEQMGG